MYFETGNYLFWVVFEDIVLGNLVLVSDSK